MPATQPVVFVTRKLPEAVEARLSRDYAPKLNRDDRALEPDDVAQGAEGADALIVAPTERFDPAALPASVRIVATYSVGHDHLDLPGLRARGITVTNTPDVLTDATAEIALLCLLGAARRAFEGQTMLRQDRWRRWTPTELLGKGLVGRKLGIVGMGRIGCAVAARARPFGLEIHYHHPRPLPQGEAGGAIYHETLRGLLAAVDVVSLHCPGSAENTGLIDAEAIEAMRDGAILVNTARGNLVDDEALIAALRSGKLFAAGLDVFAGEPAIHPAYRDLPNCYVLPHMGSATIEARNGMGFRCLDNLDAFFKGEPPPDKLA